MQSNLTFKPGDVFFDKEGTFIRVLNIEGNTVRYAIKHSDELVYNDNHDWTAKLDAFPFELMIVGYMKYTKAARLLYGKF